MPTRSLLLVSTAAVTLAAGCQDHQTAKPAQATPLHTETGDAWRDQFPVDKTKLSSMGSNRYFLVQPGTRRMYRGEGATLTVTVLDQTEVIDGVTTRVIEEREEEGGQLKEISRNFFAMDLVTGDVYYFGEDVDIYKNGKVVNHEGAWRSGLNGARFGLFLPGEPRMGDRFYQEVAAGIAMDRVEVVGVDERLKTPAGVFEHCVRIKETTPLESGASYKWFAPGFGMVKDDELALVAQESETR